MVQEGDPFSSPPSLPSPPHFEPFRNYSVARLWMGGWRWVGVGRRSYTEGLVRWLSSGLWLLRASPKAQHHDWWIVLVDCDPFTLKQHSRLVVHAAFHGCT